jgi:kynurenine formamidase
MSVIEGVGACRKYSAISHQEFRVIRKTSLAAVIAALALWGCAAPNPAPPVNRSAGLFEAADIVDLTHTLDKDFPFIPVPGITFGFALEPIATLEKNGVAANAWRIHEHMGTQIDAPSHFSAGGQSMEALGAQALIAPVVVIDFRRESELDRDAVIQSSHIKSWEQKHGRIPAGAVVAVYTGWDRKIAHADYIGLDDKHVKHFPGFGPEAVRFLVRERNIWGVAVDTISFDVGIDGTYAAHRELLGAGKWALEALNNLAQLPATGATVFIGAPKVRDATGGIARVIAWVPKTARPQAALEGVWRSTAIETIGGARPTYLTRSFSFERDRWSVEFTVFADAAGTTPTLRGRNAGRFVLGNALRLSDAVEADFIFELRSLTPLTDGVAAVLTAAKCGTSAWTVGQSQDVTSMGCAAFRVPQAQQCPREFDVVRFDAGQLFLGPRPSAGDLCAAQRRPAFAEGAALRRE